MTFEEQMVEMVKATGQELIDRAEELVGEGEAMTEPKVQDEIDFILDTLYWDAGIT